MGRYLRIESRAVVVCCVWMALTSCTQASCPDGTTVHEGRCIELRDGGMLDASSVDASTERDAGESMPDGGEHHELSDAGGNMELPDASGELPDGSWMLDAGTPPTPDAGCTTCECVPSTTRACPGGLDRGECEAGMQTCDAEGMWAACTGMVGPRTETCNGRDDDCNGSVDDGTAVELCGSVPSGAQAHACIGGACTIVTCAARRADCNASSVGGFSDGCEIQLETLQNCTECGETCAFACTRSGCNDAVGLALGGFVWSCALQANGTAACWGANVNGQLGIGNRTDQPSPVAISALTGISELRAGHSFGCARVGTVGNNVHCWGDATWGQLGEGASATVRTTPLAAIAGLTASHLSAGADHACAVTSGGRVTCWGRTERGQCGVTTADSIVTPRSVSITGNPTITKVVAGGRHTCALTSTGAVYCWGDNTSGQLGNGETTTTPQTTPVRAGTLTDVTELALGDFHTCALLRNQDVYCWGANASRQVENTNVESRMAPVRVLQGARAIGTGAAFSCAILNTGRVQCWGDNYGGQLGNGTTGGFTGLPQTVLNVENATAIEAGYDHACARLSSGGVRCWGVNVRGARGCEAAPGHSCVVTLR